MNSLTSTSANQKTNGNGTRFAPPSADRAREHCDHLVQFYDDDSFLIDSVASFIGAGLRDGEGTIVIATQAHLSALDDFWRREGLDSKKARAEGRYLPLDAEKTLSMFMVDGMPDRTRFQHAIRPVITQATQAGRPVRAFGEMVALLWLEGKASAAIRLEQLWNELIQDRPFSLLCAYPMRAFRGAHQHEPFLHVCQEHTRVLPAETYTSEQELETRHRAISELQQKAVSLETEVAERKRAECASRAEQTKLTVAANLAQLGVWELDLMTNELTGSEFFKRAIGLAPEEPLSFRRFLERMHADDVAQFQAALRTTTATGADFKAEFRVAAGAEDVRWIAMMGRGFHNGAHRLLGATLDITERKRAAEILEKTVHERTVELRETVAEIEAFSYSISHDMRAPLRAIQGFANILLDDCSELQPENRTYLDRIAASAQRMDRLIQDVLTFSRVARTELNLEPVNLDHLLRGILECYPHLQAPLAEVTISGALPHVRGNASALTQCLANLLGNAVKFVTPGSQPRVRVWAELTEDSDRPRGVRLYIQDNGIGIPEEHQDRIFGIFQRLHKHYDGTGIGLAIVKKAAERMGGKVGLSSRANEGCTFWLELQAV